MVQETSARLGAASGRGLLDLVRERFGVGWAACMIGVVVPANGGLIVAEFVGIGAAAELLGASKPLAVLGAAALVVLLAWPATCATAAWPISSAGAARRWWRWRWWRPWRCRPPH